MAHRTDLRQRRDVCRDWPGAYSGGVGELDSPDEDGTKGFAPSAGVRVLKAVRVPGALLLLGIVLLFVGPVPGLAAFLVIGAGLATFVMGMTALIGL
ncbi:MAG TPA: hypothetical protein VFR40_01930 [Lapillicoccus sp.]|nr:hypothetical protein [Lapillicoccus sp.]